MRTEPKDMFVRGLPFEKQEEYCSICEEIRKCGTECKKHPKTFNQAAYDLHMANLVLFWSVVDEFAKITEKLKGGK